MKTFAWHGDEEAAFLDIKEAYRENKVLLIFNPEKQIWVHADASDYAIGSVISQENDQGKKTTSTILLAKVITGGNELYNWRQRNVSNRADVQKVQVYVTRNKVPSDREIRPPKSPDLYDN